MKKWAVRKADTKAVEEITAKTDLKMLVAAVLSARGMKDTDSISEFFSQQEYSDPFLLKDMHEACEYITQAIEEQKYICIYGDYDCDGVTSTTVLYSYLECLGANVTYYIPERDSGYGLNKTAIDELENQGVELIITVDNGISAVQEAEYIKRKGMELIVTDHHQPPETLPDAVAIINPHRLDDTSTFKQLAGVGVVMKLIAGLEDGSYDAVNEQFGDLVCIGTIADVVPLVGENRTIVRNGLRLLSNTENEGLSNLLQAVKCGQNITSTSVAYLVAPRINASGRFGSATTAVKLFLDDENPQKYVDELVSLNTQRKKTEEDILKDIDEILVDNPQILNQRIIVLSHENWHHGVIGIVSSRITERYGKPCFIISVENGEARGSARSIKGYNIYEALSSCSEILTRFGGHELAGGFSLPEEKIEDFRNMLYEYSKENYDNMPVMTLVADKVLEGNDLDIEQIQSLSLLEPYGEGNPLPLFLMIGARVDKIVSLSEGKHTRLELFYKGKRASALLFNTSPDKIAVRTGEYGDFLVNAEINEFKGNKSVSLKVKDYRINGISQEKYFSAKSFYERIKRDEKTDSKIIERIVPSREELVYVYKYISKINGRTSTDDIFAKITNDSMNYCKYRLCLDIFGECGFIKHDIIEDTVVFIPPTKKADLENSAILKKLRCM